MVGEDFSKALSPILGAFPRKVTLVRLVQLRKAPPQMMLTLLGIVMLVRLVQLEKAAPPILLTLSGMVMLVRLVHK